VQLVSCRSDVLVELNGKARAVVVGGTLQKAVCRRTKIDAERHLSVRCQTDDVAARKVSSAYEAVADFPSAGLCLRRHRETAAISHHSTSPSTIAVSSFLQRLFTVQIISVPLLISDRIACMSTDVAYSYACLDV